MAFLTLKGPVPETVLLAAKAATKKAAKKPAKAPAKKKAPAAKKAKAAKSEGGLTEHERSRKGAPVVEKIGAYTIRAHEGETDGAVVIHGQEHHIFTGKSALSHAKQYATERTEAAAKKKEAKPKPHSEAVDKWVKQIKDLHKEFDDHNKGRLSDKDEPSAVKRVEATKKVLAAQSETGDKHNAMIDKLRDDKSVTSTDVAAIVKAISPHVSATTLKTRGGALKKLKSEMNSRVYSAHRDYGDYMDSVKAEKEAEGKKD